MEGRESEGERRLQEMQKEGCRGRKKRREVAEAGWD